MMCINRLLVISVAIQHIGVLYMNDKNDFLPSPTLAKIRAHIPELSNSEIKVANWVLINAKKVSKSSMSEVAKECGVSDMTVLRFCRTCGFQGFMDLKICIIQDTHSPSKMIHDEIELNDNIENIAKKVFLSNIQALQDTITVMDFKLLDKAIEYIQISQRILIVGVATSIPIVSDTYNKFFRLGLNCKAQTDSYLQLMEVALMGPDDLVIAISQSGSSSDPVYTLKEAQKNDVKTICITGNANSPLTKFADITLLSVSNETRPETISSRIAQVSIIDALYVALALKDVDKTTEAEKKIWDAITCKTI